MNKFKNKLFDMFDNYLFAILLLMTATINAMLIIKDDYQGLVIADSGIKIVLSLIYGGIIATVIGLLLKYKKFKQDYLLYLMAPVTMLLIYFLVLKDINAASNIIKYLLLSMATIAAYFIIPYFKNKEDSDYFTYKVILALITTGLIYLISILGIGVILKALVILFDINIASVIYTEIFIFILGFIMPSVFFLMINDQDKRENYPQLIINIINYIVMPVMAIYTIILYAYGIKILINWSFPTNVVGYLVMIYAIISLIILYFTKNMTLKPMVNKFLNIYPYLLMVPMLMMLASFMIRIGAYGITESRYFGLLTFILVIGTIIILRELKQVKYMLYLLIILLLIATCGPLSSSSLSKYSQGKRIEAILKRNNMLNDNNIIVNKNVSLRDQNQVIQILEYYEANYSFKDLKMLPRDFDMTKVDEVFGFYYPVYITTQQ